MVSSIPEPHHHFPPDKQQQQHPPLFNKGDAVEVCSDEEGFAGAWFPATIIESSPKKRKKKVIVRYDTLLDDDGRTPLTESVDPAFIRPLPPGDAGVQFQVNQVVDARYKDGWWFGVVGKVLQEGKRYRVLFDNPPDFVDCDENDLRSHLDWVFGKWVRPHKLTRKRSKGEEVFGAGADVEVNLDKETVGDTWLPAVVIKRSEDQTFLVKCQGLDSLDDAVVVVATKEDVVVVDYLHIRPCPPCHSRTFYNLLDHVDGLIAGSWQKGLVIKVAKGKYTVYLQQQKEDKEFSFSELRPHLDWDNGEWKSKSIAQSEGLVVALMNPEKLDSGDIPAENPQLAVVPVSPGASYDNISEKTPCSSTTGINMEDSTISAEKSNVFASSNKKIKVISDISGKQFAHCTSLMEGDAGEAPLSVRRQKETSNQKATSSFPVKETLRDLVISKPQKGSLTNAKSSPVCNQLSAKTKKRQANLVDLDCQQVPMVACIGRDTKSSVGSSLVSVTDKESSPENCTITLVKNGEDVPKEDDVPLTLGLGSVRMSHSSNSKPTRAGDRLNPLGDKNRGSESPGEWSLEPNQQKLAASGGRKRGRPRRYYDKSSKIDAGSTSLETSSTDGDGQKMVVKAVTDGVGGELQLELESTVPPNKVVDKSADVSETVKSVNEADMSVVGAPEGVAEDDQPLSSWCGGFSSPMSTHEDRLLSPSVDGCSDRKKRQVDPAANSSSVSTNPDALLFVKKSPVWATLESMEIFKSLPQRPHFRPLKSCEEIYCEGAAVGIMVTFANVFDKISSLTISDSMSSFESSLKTLSDFEKHGFDVSVPRGRINTLLSLRNPHMDWLNEAKNAERELNEHVEGKRKLEATVKKLEATVKELEDKILALQQTVAATKGEMEGKEARIAVVQSQVVEMKKRIGDARSEFERVVSSPWKLPR